MNKNTKTESSDTQRTSLSRGVRFAIFITLMIIQAAINISSGCLSSASTQIKKQMGLNDKQYGYFGSSNGFGRILGTAGYILIVNTIDRRWTMIVTMLAKGLSCYAFAISNSLWVMIFVRGLLGIEHIPPMIYIPVWIDQFGILKFKTFFMTLVQVITPMGKVSGYLLHILFTNDHWKWGFVVEGIILHLAMVFFLCVSGVYFSSKLVVVKDIEGGGERIEKKEARVVSIFEARIASKADAKESFSDEMKIIFSRPVYVISLFIRAMVFGVNTAIHYWIGDYMRTVIKVEGAKVFGAYTIIAISGPFGGLFAGSIINVLLGGYENKHSSLALIAVQSIACAFGIASCFSYTIFYYCGLTTLYFVFNSVAQPLVQGIILTSVDPKNKGTAFTIANLSTQITTGGPFPFFYGAVNDYFKKDYPNMAMLTLIMIATISILPMILMSFFRYRTFADKKKKEEQLIAKSTDEPTGTNDDDIELQKMKK